MQAARRQGQFTTPSCGDRADPHVRQTGAALFAATRSDEERYTELGPRQPMLQGAGSYSRTSACEGWCRPAHFHLPGGGRKCVMTGTRAGGLTRGKRG